MDAASFFTPEQKLQSTYFLKMYGVWTHFRVRIYDLYFLYGGCGLGTDVA